MKKMPTCIVARIGAAIRARRHKMGLTLRNLADQTDLSVTHICNVERGLARISADRLYGIALALNTTVGSFFKGLPK